MKDFEEMEVWRDAQDLAVDVYNDYSKLKDYSFCDQIKRAAVSVSNNIAEGNGKFTGADRCRFFDIARGSALESAAALDVLVAKKRCASEEVVAGKDRLWSIVSMLVGLIRSNSNYRLHEGGIE